MDIKSKAKKILFHQRPLIFLDLETTGLNPQRYEIIEIGALKVKPEEPFEILEELNILVQPDNIKAADRDALKINGYSKEKWVDAVSLKDALDSLDKFAENGILLGFNVTFDWAFLTKAYFSIGREDPFHYHRLDILSMAFLKFASKTSLKKYGLGDVCEALKINRENHHHALGDAKTAYLVFKSLMS